MALTQLKTGAIADDAVTTDKLANAINTARDANTAKTTNATHTGDVTGSGSLTIADNAVTLAKMAGGTDGQIITYDASGDPVAVGPGTDGQVLTSTGAGSPPAFEAIPSSGRTHNIIVNGACNVAQRGTSSTSSDYGSVDRMKMSVTNTDELAFAQKQTSDGPDGFKNCFEFDVTTAESALAADELVYMRYLVEAQDLGSFYNANGTGKNFTLSFYVKAAQTGAYSLGIHKADNTTRFITTTYTIAQADTWQRVEWNITGDTGTSGINDDNGQGFQISFIFAAGTDYTSGGVQSSWGGFSNSLMAGGQAVNTLSSTDNYWRMTGLQLELGDSASDFSHKSYPEDLALCQRYCQKFDGLKINARMNGGTNSDGYWSFPTMRATPTFSSDVSAGKSMEYGSVSIGVANVYGGGQSPECAYSRFNLSGSGTSGHASYNNLSTGSYYLLEAEL